MCSGIPQMKRIHLHQIENLPYHVVESHQRKCALKHTTPTYFVEIPKSSADART